MNTQRTHTHDSHVQSKHETHERHDTGHESSSGREGFVAHSVHRKTNDSMQHKQHNGHEVKQHEGAHADHTGHEKIFRRRFWISLGLSAPVLLFSTTVQSALGYSTPAFPGSSWITPAFATIVFLYGGLPFLQMAIPEWKNRRPGMMTLISLAISVSFVYSIGALFLGDTVGFFWELVTLIDIMLLGHWIEMRSVRQASSALDELAKLMPDTAERITSNGTVDLVAVSALRDGDIVLVRPGASIPADGKIEEGDSRVNEAMITGESLPVAKKPGNEVIAGTINGDGSLRVRVLATGQKTALAGIMRLVQQAQQGKSRAQALADRAAGWLFFIALGVAALTAIAWTIATGFNVEVIARVATVLVIACPHALGLAIPLVVAITTSLGASNGILVRDRLALEMARNIDVVVFDKTGTLTEGEIGVVDLATSSDWTADQALALATAIEKDSEHTIARGFRKATDQQGIHLPAITAFEAIKGKGVRAQHEGHAVYVGGPRLLETLELEPPSYLDQFIDKAKRHGHSVAYLISDDEVVAGFALADVIRPESRQAIERLRKLGIDVAMLTGDSEAVARSVADDLGIDHYFAEVLPADKQQKIGELQRDSRHVAMVGDGVNDAPALAQANVGIAIGSGTDVAIESAGIILVRSDPLDVVKIFELSKASYKKMVQNLLWATGYNVVALPLAAGVLAPLGVILSPAVGAVLMSLSTVIVALNAQLLRRQVL